MLAFSCQVPDGEKLIIISPHWEGIQREYTWAFQEWYKKQHGREVEIEWLDQGGTSDDIAVGVNVEVKGRMRDGVLVADKVSFEGEEDEEDE